MIEAGSRYREIRSRSAAVFDLDARLPGPVFKGGAEDALFGQFDAVLAPDFWRALRAMATWHGDAFVELLVLEPECEEFYLPEYQIYPAFSLSVEAGVDDYWASIGREPGGDVMGSIAISANVIAVTGHSGKWGCWGERDAELAVFAGFPTTAARDEWRSDYGPFLGASEALESYLPLAFGSRTVPDAYAERLMANYSSQG
jgi:hypothetical protein